MMTRKPKKTQRAQGQRVAAVPTSRRQECPQLSLVSLEVRLRRHRVQPPHAERGNQVCAGGAAGQDVCRKLTVIRPTSWLCGLTQPALLTCCSLQKASIFSLFPFYQTWLHVRAVNSSKGLSVSSLAYW